jgi:hypothetical protein
MTLTLLLVLPAVLSFPLVAAGMRFIFATLQSFIIIKAIKLLDTSLAAIGVFGVTS